MSLAVHTSVIVDTATPALKKLAEGMTPRALAEKLDGPITLLVKGNYEKQPPNKQGFPTTNFWQRASKATGSSIQDSGLLVYTTLTGVRQRYFGGVIEAGHGTSTKTGAPTKYLAIAARSEAYGKTPAMFKNLVCVFRRVMGQVKAIGLAQADASLVSFGGKRKNGSRAVHQGPETGGGIMFWLVESVRQAAYPGTLPSDAEFFAVIDRTLGTLIT